ncbi:MAG: hypothetical protein EOP84_26860 [Verrucomicrobiaceae bacterium]|nr:MAG: hypothetical protein EOP84_26860 [Verrucomicrobiaceae bacterium]
MGGTTGGTGERGKNVERIPSSNQIGPVIDHRHLRDAAGVGEGAHREVVPARGERSAIDGRNDTGIPDSPSNSDARRFGKTCEEGE